MAKATTPTKATKKTGNEGQNRTENGCEETRSAIGGV